MEYEFIQKTIFSSPTFSGRLLKVCLAVSAKEVFEKLYEIRHGHEPLQKIFVNDDTNG